MKIPSEKQALEHLEKIREDLRDQIRNGYEHRAKDCATCETQGACCLDAHFVNVRISRLEAAAIRNTLDKLSDERRLAVYSRVDEVIERFGLQEKTESDHATYACPLFEKGMGCLVHTDAKPLPCITHACYERKEDMPPDELLERHQLAVERLNFRTFLKAESWLPIPLAIRRVSNRDVSVSAPSRGPREASQRPVRSTR